MPPRANPSGNRGRGGPAIRGTPTVRGGSRGGAPTRGGAAGLPDASSHITTIGVKRNAFGQSGRATEVWTNHFEVKIPEANIHHYDVISPSEKQLPARLNMQIIERLQIHVAPAVFTPRAVYDGRKNLYAARELPFGETGTHEFTFTLSEPSSEPARGEGEVARGPKQYKVKLTHVATINPEVLARFLVGKQSHDNMVLTAITALNVVIRMEPSLKYPFNVRSFFTRDEQRDIGNGIVLWRGYFQSIRPAIGRMLINVDISTGAMYKPGRVIDVALDFIGRPGQQPALLSPSRGFPERERVKLQRYLSGVRVHVQIPGQPTNERPPRVVKKLTSAGANQMSFTMRDGVTLNVAQYFQRTYNYNLRFPDLPCLEVGNGALIPMELCSIPEGQIMRKQLPPEKTKDMVEFATKRPNERLDSIKRGLGVLAYGQSDYVRQFGLHVDPNAGPKSLQARILNAPTLQYGAGSRQPTITPRDGAWNMIDKKFYKPCTIKRWAVVVYEREGRFQRGIAEEMVDGLKKAFGAVGIVCQEQFPLISYQHSSGNIATQLRDVGRQCLEKNQGQGGPDLIVVVLPESSVDMYTAVKHFGDITQGVATQVLKSSKCSRAKPQYFANVCLKINVKMGGINTVPDARSVPVLTDPHNPTVVMGADVIHPAPGADGRPSFTALVSNVDSDTAKYIADCRVQTSRQEMIDDLGEMAFSQLKMYQQYRQLVEKKPGLAPKRIIFYRDGVSEGQFKQVLDYELPQLKEACKKAGVQPKITVIVVGKRHHVRFFPKGRDADRSGNCLAESQWISPFLPITCPPVTDTVSFWVYTLLGTSRPAHYSVLYDENNFTPDALQALSFALCHVYARSTRSVSIPAPVYYADIVCARAKNHYDPSGSQADLSESATRLDSTDAQRQLEAFKANFKPLNDRTRRVMYFS